MEDYLNFFENGRQPKFVENGRRPHFLKMDDCHKKFKQQIMWPETLTRTHTFHTDFHNFLDFFDI